MQSKPLPRNPAELRADRVCELNDFIESSLASLSPLAGSSILLVARSPESVAFQAVFGLSARLAGLGIEARVVLMSGEAGEQWNVEFAPDFRHEIRLGRDIRLLDAHEQIVAGDRSVWYGDSMRRDPERRDLFSQFNRDAVELTRCARLTFERLWGVCKPLYRHEFPAVSIEGPSPKPADAALAHDMLATLEAWQPPSRQ